VILSSPGFVPAVPIPRYRQLLGACLLPIAPRQRFELGITTDQLTADPNAQHARDTDPLVFSSVSVRWYYEYRSAAEQCLSRAAELKLPVYVCVGAADNVVAPSGARQFVDTVTSCDKTLRVWDGLLHEPLNEHVGDMVAAEIVAWLDRQLTSEIRG
jgi:lysophospholipase